MASPLNTARIYKGAMTIEDVYLVIRQVTASYPELDIERYTERAIRALEGKTLQADQVYELLTMHALDMLKAEEPNWTFVATATYLNRLYLEASENRGYVADERYGSLYTLIEKLTEIGIFTPHLLSAYTKDEIEELAATIDPSRDQLFTYIGLRTLADRYLARDHVKKLYELPQERFMIIAMTLMQTTERTPGRARQRIVLGFVEPLHDGCDANAFECREIIRTVIVLFHRYGR